MVVVDVGWWWRVGRADADMGRAAKKTHAAMLERVVR
jgi:hypothetical protein